MYIGVVGGRTYPDKDFVHSILHDFIKKGDTIISGGASGVDSFAKEFAEIAELLFVCYPPLEADGEDAYTKRNQRIADDCELLLVFPSYNSVGTYDTIAKAKKAGKRIIVFPIPRVD